MQLNALLRLAFAPAPQAPLLSLAAYEQLAGPLYKRYAVTSYEAPTACRHEVSGTISLPSRGAFHLSLTVLVHYRSSRVFSLGRWSARLPTQFHVLGGTQEHFRRGRLFGYGAVTRSGRPSQAVRLSLPLVTPSGGCRPGEGPTTPPPQRRQALTRRSV